MLGPDSRLLTIFLIAVAVALLVGLVRFRMLPVRILCGALSIVFAMTGGVAAVNYYYCYYPSWSQLCADMHGTTGNLGTVVAGTDTTTTQTGALRWIDLPGKLSGYDRQGLIYLPPQYSEPQYAKARFPVIELFHGSPGKPLTWQTEMHIDQMANQLISEHLMGPVIIVMPQINGPGNHNTQDCVNSPSLKDETYLTRDVRNDILAHYRASKDDYEWGLGGYSSGGFCAANIALRHRTWYGAAAIINGYYLASSGPAGQALKGNQLLETANSPLHTAEIMAPNSGPLPAFWVAAGVNDKSDYQPALYFTEALSRFEQVPFSKMKAGDTANAWKAALNPALIWMWQQIATPDLKSAFPVRSAAATPAGTAAAPGTITVPPVKRHPKVTPCKTGVTCTSCNTVTCNRPVMAKPVATGKAL